MKNFKEILLEESDTLTAGTHEVTVNGNDMTILVKKGKNGFDIFLTGPGTDKKQVLGKMIPTNISKDEYVKRVKTVYKQTLKFK